MFIKHPYFDDGAGDNGGGNPPELSEQEKTEAAEFETLIDKGEDKLTDEEKVKYNSYKEKYNFEELDPDTNKPITPERKIELADIAVKVKAIQDKKEEARTKEENDFLGKHVQAVKKTDLYKDAEELSGFAFADGEVDFGDTKPNTPEWIAKRETALYKRAQKEFDGELQSRFPEAYRLMQFMERGGKVEDFIKPENRDFTTVSLNKADTSNHERVYRESLAARGTRPEHIEALVKIAKDSGKLFEEAKTELEAVQLTQKSKRDRESQEEEARLQADNTARINFARSLADGIEKGLNGNPIPLPDRRKFLDFISNNTVYQDGKFLLVRELNTKEISKEIGIEWFRYKGGDVKALAEKKAQDIKAQELKSRIVRKITPKSTGSATKAYTPIGEL